MIDTGRAPTVEPDGADARDAAPPDARDAAPLDGRARFGALAMLLALAAAIVLLAAVHVTQGTSGIPLGRLLDALGGTDAAAADVLVGSRLPRLGAALLVGAALGVAGAVFQSLARNALASPDTLAVTAGSYLAVTVVAAFGLAVPLWASGALAFVGGLAAAALVLLLAGGAGSSTTRLILAGTAIALALQSITSALLILFAQQTTGLYAWGSGSLSQLSGAAVAQAAPLIGLAIVAALVLSRRLDVLGLGDDAALSLGIRVRRVRTAGVLIAVVLTAASVTLAGPIGFVGLVAPVIARLLARLVPGLHRHLALLPASALIGAAVVTGADVALRAALGSGAAIAVPTGVATTLVGAVVLVVLAHRGRDVGGTRRPPGAGGAPRSRRRFAVVTVVAVAAAASALLVGLLVGSTGLLLGDVLLWLRGEGAPVVRFALDERAPRVVGAVIAGAALALSGAIVQSGVRNPLAEPGLLGITGGAGLGAVVVVTALGGGSAPMLVAAVTAGLLAFALVYALARRGGLRTDRLVLIGIGVGYGATAVTTFLLIRSSPWDTPRLATWLSGSTYGRGWEQVLPVAVALMVAIPLAVTRRRELDLLAVDDDLPRLLGVRLERERLALLGVAGVLAALSVAAVGVVGFVGLVAPHAARALVGARHARVIPVSMAIGATLLGVADLLGRALVAPAQIPAGLLVAVLGAPYFVYLLARTRA